MMHEIIFAAMVFMASAVSAQAACPAESATYTITGDKTFSMNFVKVKEPKAWSELGLTLTTSTRSLSYEFTASNGYETFYLVSLDAKPLDGDDPAVYFFDTTLMALPLPQTRDPAPAYIFIPTLGNQLWYAGREPREFLPTEMWKLSGCVE